MSVPHVIYYCWFGRGPLPSLAEKCLASWKRYCPDYEIVCINEDSFDVTRHPYTEQAYAAKKWAFVSDVARLQVLYDNGGIYLDTDVELLKSPNDLIAERGFMGFDDSGLIATGLGFACEPHNAVIGEMLRDYDGVPFVKEDGSLDTVPCPDRNTATLRRLGMTVDGSDQVFMGLRMLPEEYLCPIKYYTGKKRITKNTYSIHHFCASWTTPTAKRTLFLKRLLGVALYDKLYGKFLHKFKWLEW